MRERKYKYQVGEVVNGTLKVVSQTRKNKRKAYEVQSLIYPDASYIYSVRVCTSKWCRLCLQVW